MKRKFTTLFAILAIALIAAGSAFADSESELVVDDARIFSSQLSQVRAEAQKLANIGVDVKVRTIQTYGSAGSLDNYENMLVRRYSSWQGAGGLRKDTILIFIIAMDERETGIYYGEQWKPVMGSRWEGIIDNKMNPRFKNGQFAEGFIAGLQESFSLIINYLNPPRQQTESPKQEPRQQTPVPTPTVAREPVNLTPLWTVLGGLMLATALIITVLFIRKIVLDNREQKEKCRAAQQKAQSKKEAASARIVDWENKIASAKTDLGTLEGQMSAKDLEAAKAALEKIERERGDAVMRFDDIGNATNMDPSEVGLSEDEYDVIEASYEEVLDALHKAEASLNMMADKIESLKRLAQETPNSVKSAGDAIARAEQAIKAVDKKLKVDSIQKFLNGARAIHQKATELLGAKEFNSAASEAERARKTAEYAENSAKNLPAHVKAIQDGIAEQQARVESVKKLTIAGRETFEKLDAEYSENCLESVHGNGTEAEKRINQSVSALEKALKEASWETQNWDEAEKLTASVKNWLSEAESFMRSIQALKENLGNLKKNSSGEIEHTQTDLNSAVAFIEKYDEDIRESLETDLADAQKTLDEAEEQLDDRKPDYLVLAKSIKDVHDTVDNILAEARSEKEAADRLREKAKTTLIAAEVEVSKAMEYIEDHSKDVEETAAETLARARKNLKAAQAEEGLEKQISFAEQAEADAKEAYEQARSDFKKAERRREERRRARAEANDSWGSSYHHTTIVTTPVWTSSPTYHSSPSPSIHIGGGGGSRSFGGGGGGGSKGW